MSTPPKKSTIGVYTSSPAQQQSLQLLTASWDFWPCDKVAAFVSQPVNQLFYLPGPTPLWQGALLVQYAPPLCDIIYLYVAPSLRGQGLGLGLLNHLLMAAAERGDIATILLEVRPSNRPAIALYEKFGMHELARRKKYYANGEDAIVYGRNF